MESKNSSNELSQDNSVDQKEALETNDIVAKVKAKIKTDGLKAESLFRVEPVSDQNRADFDQIWQQVWHREGFDDGDLEKTKSHYQIYDGHSQDLLLYFKPEENDEQIPIGTMRLIWDERGGFPAFNDFKVAREWKEKDCVEFTLLTVLPEWRGLEHLNTLFLWREGCRIMRKRGIDNILYIADKSLIDVFENVGFVIHKISLEDKYHEGNICSVYSIVYSENFVHLGKNNPDLLDFFEA
jgi:hypothetical protein